MKIKNVFSILAALSLFICSNRVIAQDNTDNNNGDDDDKLMEKKGFHVGLFIGPYWANKSTSWLYDGHGLDANGNENDFYHSQMYYKIIDEYGGIDPYTGTANGQPDQIAAALGVDPQSSGGNTWHFGPNDMPQNMHYNIAFLVGLNCHYSTDKKGAFLINLNASKLIISGNFTIETDIPPNSNQLGSAGSGGYVNTFPIKGGEERLMGQFGYSRILGNNRHVNFFLEGGLNATLAKYLTNVIQIDGLTIDLTTAYIPPNSGGYAYQIYFPHHIGIGFGAFASAGFNITISPKYTVQLLYSPTYDKINLGPSPSYKLQQAAGFRAYYNF